MNLSNKLHHFGLKKTLIGYILFTLVSIGTALFMNASWEVLLVILFVSGSILFVFIFLSILFLKKNYELNVHHLNRLESNINTHTSDMLFWSVNQLEASTYLQSFISPRIPLPNTRQGAASPDLLSIIFQKIILNDPKTIVEFGAGVSTLFIGHLIKERKLGGKIHAVDHSEEYFKIIEDNVANTGLSDEVRLYYCPLKKHNIKGKEWLWYDISNLTVPSIDLLIIDGPPGVLQEKVRYPAVPVLIDRLADGALIIVDDYKRYDDAAMVKDWLVEIPQLKLIAELNTEKGTAILQKTGK